MTPCGSAGTLRGVLVGCFTWLPTASEGVQCPDHLKANPTVLELGDDGQEGFRTGLGSSRRRANCTEEGERALEYIRGKEVFHPNNGKALHGGRLPRLGVHRQGNKESTRVELVNEAGLV